jgi:8-oxo-dGTP diphosphatase
VVSKGLDPERIVGALLVRHGNVLLGLRAAHKTFPNCWDMFGGHIEAGETEVAALVRELDEELRICPTQFQKTQHILLENDRSYLDLAISAVTQWTGGEPAMLGGEHIEIKWFTIADALSLTNLATDEIKTILQNFT